MTKMIPAVYERGVIRPRKRLPLQEHAIITLIIRPSDPVSKTRGAFNVSRRAAEVLIYDDTLLDA